MLSHEVKQLAKIRIFKNLTHLLKLVDKMCAYEMGPLSIVKDTEQTRFRLQMGGPTDKWTDRLKEE